MSNKISSKDNPSFKYLKKLSDKSSFRKREEKFLVEGLNEISLCMKSNYDIEVIYISTKKNINIFPSDIKINFINEDLLEKITYRKTEGVIAIVKIKKQYLKDIVLDNNEFILVLENPEKPGNIGAIMRTYEACGFKNIFIVNSKIEVYNPNTIRSSLGSIFHLNIFKLDYEQMFNFLKKNQFKVYSSFIKSKKRFDKANYIKKCALIMGPEKDSVSPRCIEKSDELIKIPMYGIIDSLNLSVATGIILYEAVKQRKFS